MWKFWLWLLWLVLFHLISILLHVMLGPVGCPIPASTQAPPGAPGARTEDGLANADTTHSAIKPTKRPPLTPSPQPILTVTVAVIATS